MFVGTQFIASDISYKRRNVAQSVGGGLSARPHNIVALSVGDDGNHPAFSASRRDAKLCSNTNHTKSLSHLGEMRPINGWLHLSEMQKTDFWGIAMLQSFTSLSDATG